MRFFFEFLPTPFLLVLYHRARDLLLRTVLSFEFFPVFCQRFDKLGSLHTGTCTQTDLKNFPASQTNRNTLSRIFPLVSKFKTLEAFQLPHE